MCYVCMYVCFLSGPSLTRLSGMSSLCGACLEPAGYGTCHMPALNLGEMEIEGKMSALGEMCEHFVVFLLQPGSITKASWPEVGVVDHTLIKETEYFGEVLHEFRVRIKKMMDIRGKVMFLFECRTLFPNMPHTALFLFTFTPKPCF